MEFGLILVPVLIIVSGAVAYIGNVVGRATGRRRLTVFGLRPRHTAHLITTLTGMLITLITLAAVFLTSQDARTALFRLNALREQIDEAEARLAEIKGGDIAYLRNEEVVREVISGRLPEAEILRRLDAARLRAADLAVAKGIAPDLVTGSVLILYPPNTTWEAVARVIALSQRERVVRIVALENALRGEPLRVFVQLVDRHLVFRKGAVLGSGKVDGQAGREQVGRELLALVDEAAARTQDRLLSPPFARITDPPRGQVDVDQHRRAVTEIVALRREVTVDLVAAQDIFTEMPPLVTFVVRR